MFHPTCWIVGGSSPDRGWEFFSSPPCPDRLSTGTWSWPLTSIQCQGQECVDLYIHSRSTPLWRAAQLKHRDNFTFIWLNLRLIDDTVSNGDVIQNPISWQDVSVLWTGKNWTGSIRDLFEGAKSNMSISFCTQADHAYIRLCYRVGEKQHYKRMVTEW
jgi:hypothetical protein